MEDEESVEEKKNKKMRDAFKLKCFSINDENNKKDVSMEREIEREWESVGRKESEYDEGFFMVEWEKAAVEYSWKSIERKKEDEKKTLLKNVIRKYVSIQDTSPPPSIY